MRWRIVVRLPGEQVDQVAQRADPAGIDPGQQRGLGQVLQRDHDPVHAGPGRGEHRRQHAAHRPDPTVQTEFTDQHPAQQRGGRHHCVGGEDGRGQRQVEAAAALGQRSR